MGLSKDSYERVEPAPKDTLARIDIWVRWQAYLCRHYILHTFNDIKKNKVNYLLGFFACFLVVFVVSLVVTIIGNTPVVFLRLAELDVGEMDMRITPGPWTGSDSLNYSAIDDILHTTPDYTYHTPRYVFSAYAVPAKRCSNLDPFNPYWKYHGPSCGLSCFSQMCPSEDFDATVYLIDTDRENRMLLGRDWDLEKLTEGYVYIQRHLAQQMNVQIGDIIYVKFNMLDVMSSIWNKATKMGPYQYTNGTTSYSLFSAATMYLPFTVKDTFSKSHGKYGSSQQSGIIVEYPTLMTFLARNADPNLNNLTLSYLNSTNLYHRAQQVIFNLPPPRIPTYINTNQDEIDEEVVQWASQILYRVGFNVVNVTLTVLAQLSNSAVISLFLGLILNIIIFILLFLSIILIYSLLMINVDTKTFEMGVMRMIGITRKGLIQLLLFQAFSYSVPSWVVGLVLSQIFGLFVASWFEGLTGVPINPRLTANAVLMATSLGILIPIVASILPIRNALGKNLHDSLDSHRSKTMAIQVTIDRAEDNTFSTPVLIIGFSLAAFGFGVYYIFPLSLLAMNFALLLNMFFFLLIGMLFGMVLLSLNVARILETAVVWVFFWWENASIPQVILKNLTAHRVRNRKTAIMYALSLGFIIFINVTYQMQETSMSYATQQQNGAFIRVTGSPITRKTELEAIAVNNPKVDSFAWVSMPLSYCASYSGQYITNLGHLYSDVTPTFAVSPNIFEVTIPGFLHVNQVADDPDINLASEEQIARQLYSSEGSKSMIVGTRFKTFLGLSIPKFSHFLEQSNHIKTGAKSYARLKPMAFLDSAPIFSFSKFPSVSDQSTLVSFPSFVRMSNGTIRSVDAIPMRIFIIKMVSGATDSDKDDLMQTLTSFTRDSSMRPFDYRNVEDPLATATIVISYFFSFTTVVAMLISFFSLMSSMFTNIHEQAKEIGILRAIGIRKGALYRIYIYEAFVLVFSSSLLGILIGTVVGYTVLLQRVLFTQLPIPFVFPTQLLIVVFICSIVFSAISAFGPIRKVLSRNVVDTLRGG